MLSTRLSRPCFRWARAFSQQRGPVGFIGLGNMGGHMASNLLKAGFPVMGYDIGTDERARAEAKGVKMVNTSAEIAQNCGVIITMLPASVHVREVYCGTLLKHVKPNTLLIDSSTISPIVAREVNAEAKKCSAQMVDAPVSGGVGGAEKGTLTFMVGGTKENFDHAKQYLTSMGKNIVHCGGPGTGQVAKVCNNLVLGISMCAVSESMNLAVKLGMDPKLLAGIINTSSGRCWSSDTYNPVPGVMENLPASRNYEGGFGVDLMKKDLFLAVEAGKQANAPIALGGHALELYEKLSKQGLGKKDFGVIYDFLSKSNS